MLRLPGSQYDSDQERQSAIVASRPAKSQLKTVRIYLMGFHKSNHRSMTSILDNFSLRNIIQCMLNYINDSSDLSPPTDLVTLALRLKVIADPTRLLLVNLLMEGVQCNCEIGDILRMQPNLISHHLHVLREAGLVNVEHDALDARWVYYSINREALDEWIADICVFFDVKRIKPRRTFYGPIGRSNRVDKPT